MPRNSATGARSGGGAADAEAHHAPWRVEVRGLRIATQRRRNKCGIAAVMNALQARRDARTRVSGAQALRLKPSLAVCAR